MLLFWERRTPEITVFPRYLAVSKALFSLVLVSSRLKNLSNPGLEKEIWCSLRVGLGAGGEVVPGFFLLVTRLNPVWSEGRFLVAAEA
ncbi:uncharacterized protein K452DRAFT_97392 [Aplosporella prunicola CBS 121167]|uniref:Uncharacterized protein n=1 Tax=Aplosporella prunicola CBS 121167 TaxID=1176127 RepID=A0A6A6B3L2_9PEZI|nr:uncharacterized protein K452DRAFT_97392 [Aplosporella prunicola CBS 121167]KAF2137953.1 hypothetical protein K452DRAFT_97392 [Aplosporella prunicola CBS 121167]